MTKFDKESVEKNARANQASVKHELAVKGQDKIEYLTIDYLEVNPFQPRKEFNEEQLADLAHAIKKHGVFVPITVRRVVGKDTFEIVDGERRARAAKLAGLDKIPAIIHLYTDSQMRVLALMSNVNRADLSDYEIALSIASTIEASPNLKKAELMRTIGVSKQMFYNYEALTSLPEKVRAILDEQPRCLGANAANDIKKTINKLLKKGKAEEDIELELVRLVKDASVGRITQAEVAKDLSRVFTSRVISSFMQPSEINFGLYGKGLFRMDKSHKITISNIPAIQPDKLDDFTLALQELVESYAAPIVEEKQPEEEDSEEQIIH